MSKTEKFGDFIDIVVSVPAMKHDVDKTCEYIEDILKEKFNEVEVTCFGTPDMFDEIEFGATSLSDPKKVYDVYGYIRDRVFDNIDNLR